jgi:hypothetical protein
MCDCTIIDNEAFQHFDLKPFVSTLHTFFHHQQHIQLIWRFTLQDYALDHASVLFKFSSYNNNNIIQFSFIYYFILLPPSSCCCCCSVHVLYDKWNKRFRSRRKLYVSWISKKRAKKNSRFIIAQKKFKSIAKENFRCWLCTQERNFNKIAVVGIFGNSQKEATKQMV